jgi:hypothetical protein
MNRKNIDRHKGRQIKRTETHTIIDRLINGETQRNTDKTQRNTRINGHGVADIGLNRKYDKQKYG